MLKTMIVNEEQLELLLDPKILPILKTFKTAKSSSEAARELGVSASKLHYHVKKLSSRVLLVTKGKCGKSTLFEIVARTFYIPEECTPNLAFEMHEMLSKMLSDIEQGLIKSFKGKLESPKSSFRA